MGNAEAYSDRLDIRAQPGLNYIVTAWIVVGLNNILQMGFDCSYTNLFVAPGYILVF
jgi:hypothetical protein